MERALRSGNPGPYQMQGAIAALHAQAPAAEQTNWTKIAALYGRLAEINPSPVVELNRSVAVAMAEGPAKGLELIDRAEVSDALDGYRWFHSSRADLLRRLGRYDEAADAYRRALALSENASERGFLHRRLAEVEPIAP